MIKNMTFFGSILDFRKNAQFRQEKYFFKSFKIYMLFSNYQFN